MKKLITAIVVVLVAGTLIGMVLTNNKKKNEAKIEIVNQSGGAVPVHVAAASLQKADVTFTANGNLAPNRELDFKSESSGIVAQILAEEGDVVKKGQVLAVIDDKFLSIEKQTAEDVYNKLLTDKTRYENSFKTGGVTQAQLDEIELQLRNAENRLKEVQRRSSDANIKAPIAGIINKKHIEVGAYLSPGSPLFNIVDVSALKLKVSVNESRVVQLQTGDSVEIHIPVFPDETYSGTITFIAPKADAALNFPVEIKVNNTSQNRVKAGMYATAVFSSNGVKEALFIPRNAFVGSVNNREIYVLNEDNTVSLKNVVPGMVVGDKVEILGGLKEGELVVTTGQINLADGVAAVVQQ